MAKEKQIIVQDTTVNFKQVKDSDYISLTDIAKWKNPEAPAQVVMNWLRLTDTVDFLGLWEQLNNKDFNLVEFDEIKKRYGRNAFTLSATQWTSKTNAIGIVAGRGKYSEGTLAHEDIALEFLSWISVEFKLYFIYEFKRLKTEENKQLSQDWNLTRQFAKINYHLHTDAIKENLIVPTLTAEQIKYKYTDEADMLNVALFGSTAKQWREQNPDKNHNKENIRDYANIHQLLVLANMESMNAELIKQNLDMPTRMEKLNKMAKEQLATLVKIENKLYLS